MILENIVCKKRDIEELTIKKNKNPQIHRRFSLFSNKGPSQEQKTKKIHKSSACSPCTPQKRRTNENQCRRDLIIKNKKQKKHHLFSPHSSRSEERLEEQQEQRRTGRLFYRHDTYYVRGLVRLPTGTPLEILCCEGRHDTSFTDSYTRGVSFGGNVLGAKGVLESFAIPRMSIFFALHSNNYTSALRFTFVQILRFLVFRVLSSLYVLSESQKDSISQPCFSFELK